VTERLYHADPYLVDFEATVVSRSEHAGRPAVVLDRTAFYPESGGQPWDTGLLGGVRVVAVIESGPDVLHVLAAPLPADHVRGLVDADRRRDHRQQHHGQHLLSRAFVDVAAATTVSFHLGAEHVTIDLDRVVSEEQALAAERKANEVVWDALPVVVRTVPPGEALGLGVAPPEGSGDAVRIVEAEGFDRQPCGGTHPRTTAEVGVILVLGRERYKGGARVRFMCGHRALAAIHARGAVLDELGTVLSAPLEGLPEAARHALDAAAQAGRVAEDLLARALDSEARRLLAGLGPLEAEGPRLVIAAYDGWSAADLRILAQRLTALAPCLALLGSRADKAHLVFAQSEGLGHDVPALLRQALDVVGGRGGGRGNMAQGGGDRPDKVDEALAAAASTAARGPA
jgi:alanyl-tRNA synthetase